MELTQKFKIELTSAQEDISWLLSEKCRFLYNFGLGHRNKVYHDTNVPITYNMQQSELPEIKRKYPEYNWVYSKVLEMVLYE